MGVFFVVFVFGCFFLDYGWGEAGRREDRTYVSWTDDGTVPV